MTATDTTTAPAGAGPAGATPEYKRLARASRAELDDVFAQGGTPGIEGLLGWEYRGYNTSPRAIDLIRLRKFTKGYFRADSGDTYGYNTPVVQNGLDGPWIAKPDDAAPTRFRFYRLRPVVAGEIDDKHPHAVLLNYGEGHNPALAIYKGLRNYVVQIHPGSDDLLLGQAYFGVGGNRFRVNYFLMERHRAITVGKEARGR